MKLTFSSKALANSLCWQKNDQSMITRINRLIKDIQREPYTGIGKLEPLKHSLAGYWSRRINDEHRIVNKVEGDQIFIAQLRYHYEY